MDALRDTENGILFLFDLINFTQKIRRAACSVVFESLFLRVFGRELLIREQESWKEGSVR